MKEPKLYLTGGALRDSAMGLTPKDYDFSVEAESYEQMVGFLLARGATIWQERPKFVTVRASVLAERLGTFGGQLHTPGTTRSRTTIDADFTLCRAETMYSDGRHPDEVTPADVLTDLKRRDFTVNAMAMSEDGELLDPFDGWLHAEQKHLRTVGYPFERFTEDPLRMLRAWRFAVTKEMTVAASLVESLRGCSALLTRDTVTVERVRDELYRGLKHNWYLGMSWLTGMPFYAVGAQLASQYPELWVKPTLEDK